MITLLPYNPTWPLLFADEKAKLQNLLNNIVIDIAHIGSTAIPNIYAKPVIDILIGVRNLREFSEIHVKKIESLGYRYNPVFESEFPYRRYFQKNDEQENRTHQIHLVNYPSAWFEKHILFRNYLRQYPPVAKEYAAHKLMLAKQFDNTLDYAKEKTEFCQTIDKLAFNDFTINKPFIETKRLQGYIPQLACFDDYRKMLSDKSFIACYGVSFNNEQINARLNSDIDHWNNNGFGPWVWHDKRTHEYVGRAGLKTFLLNNKNEIELTYAIKPNYWGIGIAAEMAQAAIQFAFNALSLNDIICFTLENNTQSLRVIEKLAFQYEKNFLHADLPHQLYRLNNAIKPLTPG